MYIRIYVGNYQHRTKSYELKYQRPLKQNYS